MGDEPRSHYLPLSYGRKHNEEKVTTMHTVPLTPANAAGITVGMFRSLIASAAIVDSEGDRVELALDTSGRVPQLGKNGESIISLDRLDTTYKEHPEALDGTAFEFDGEVDAAWVQKYGEEVLPHYMPETQWELSDEEYKELQTACSEFHELAERLGVPFLLVCVPASDEEKVSLSTTVMAGGHVNRVDNTIPRMISAVEAIRDPSKALREAMASQGIKHPVAN